MSGIYIHVPFCRQACNYCNFHFSTSLKLKDNMVDALVAELFQRKEYINTKIETVYFGGGTPSLLTEKDLDKIWEAIYKNYSTDNLLECTLEANPDDINKEYLKTLHQFPIDRLSIGIQSFKESDLKYMNRAHSASETEKAVKLAQDAGFENITIDLIYGTPGLSNQEWKNHLQKAIDWDIPHISSYALTIEEKTKLAHDIRMGKSPAPSNELTAQQFEIMVASLCVIGFEHYEISNFAKHQKYAVHNTNYWKGVPYLGIGPSAHSYNGDSRQWNIANNALYIKGMNEQQPNFEVEQLSIENKMNESLLIGLRTMWGVNLDEFETHFGEENKIQLYDKLNSVNKCLYQIENNKLLLTAAGKLFADHIASELFF